MSYRTRLDLPHCFHKIFNTDWLFENLLCFQNKCALNTECIIHKLWDWVAVMAFNKFTTLDDRNRTLLTAFGSDRIYHVFIWTLSFDEREKENIFGLATWSSFPLR